MNTNEMNALRMMSVKDAEIERLQRKIIEEYIPINSYEAMLDRNKKIYRNVIDKKDAEIEKLRNLLTECDGKLGRKPCQTGRCMEYIGLIGLAADNAEEIEQLTADLASVRKAARDLLARIDASPERTLLEAAIFE